MPIADVLLPNVYELGHLTGPLVQTRAEAEAALGYLADGTRARAIIGTGSPDSAHPGELAIMALSDGPLDVKVFEDVIPDK